MSKSIESEEAAYKQALAYLYKFVDFSLTHQEQVSPERFELERMARLLEMLGEPHKAYPSIHIAGTKGKGSVAAHCAAACRKAGLRTGLYTSPHLHDFRERIQINGEHIPGSVFVELVERLKVIVDELPGLTSYELQTALAFMYFADQQVDCAVVEVGMGGRLDSTNVLTPLVAVITSISYDHTFVLGDTLAQIAGEKGGIIKPGIAVVSAPQQEEALQVLRQMAEVQGSPFILTGTDLRYQALEHSLEGQKFVLWWDKAPDNPLTLETRLLGAHQVENATTAYAALYAVRTAGLDVPDEAIAAGFKQVVWPGRFEVIPGQPTVVFDGAHNRYSARVLAQAMQDYFPGKPVTLIFGASEDKDIAGMFAELLPRVAHLIVAVAGHPRAADAARLIQLAQDYDCTVQECQQPEQALPEAHKLTGPEGIVLVTGSLYLVGQLRYSWLGN